MYTQKLTKPKRGLKHEKYKHGSNYWPHFRGGDSNSPCHDNRSTALAGEADTFWRSLFGRYMNDVDKTTFFTLYFTKLH